MPDYWMYNKLYRRDGRRFVKVDVQEKPKDGLWLVMDGGHSKQWLGEVDELKQRDVAKIKVHKSKIADVVLDALMKRKYTANIIARQIIDAVITILEEEAADEV